MRAGARLAFGADPATHTRDGSGFDIERVGLRGERLPLCAIACWFVGCAALVNVWIDVPVIDDWTYAASVEHLLRTGQLRILEISAIHPVALVLWGALFCLPFGFSFAALRVSTVVLAMIGACAFYLTLRELRWPRRASMLGTALLSTCPAVMLLTHSFMADVPMLGVSCCALLFYVRAHVRQRCSELWIAGLFATAAVLVRQVAIALPLSALCAVLFAGDWKRGRAAAVFASACGLLSALAGWLLASRWFGVSQEEAARLSRLRFITSASAFDYTRWLLEVLLMLAFLLAPAALAAIRLRSRFMVITLLAALALGLLDMWLGGGELLDPLRHATLNLNELGMARDLIAGNLAPPDYARWASFVARGVMLLSAGAVVAAGVLGSGVALARLASTPPAAAATLLLCGALHLGIIMALWLFNDRYYLALLPSAIWLLLRVLQPARIRGAVVALLLAAQAVIGIVGTRDALAYNRVCQSAYRALLHAGVPARDIDGGWSFNGWMLYAHPENLLPGADRNNAVPQVTDKASSRFALAITPLPGYDVVETLQWKPAPWPNPSRLLILRRTR